MGGEKTSQHHKDCICPSHKTTLIEDIVRACFYIFARWARLLIYFKIKLAYNFFIFYSISDQHSWVYLYGKNGLLKFKMPFCNILSFVSILYIFIVKMRRYNTPIWQNLLCGHEAAFRRRFPLCPESLPSHFRSNRTARPRGGRSCPSKSWRRSASRKKWDFFLWQLLLPFCNIF